jgi:hypothetical protein
VLLGLVSAGNAADEEDGGGLSGEEEEGDAPRMALKRLLGPAALE